MKVKTILSITTIWLLMAGVTSLWAQEANVEVFPQLGQFNPEYIAYRPDGKRIISSQRVGKTIIVWDLESGREFRTILTTSHIYSIAYSPDGKRFVCGEDGIITLWDDESGKLLRFIRGHTSAVRSITFSPDGMRIASGGSDGEPIIRICDVESGRQLMKLEGHTGWINSLVYSPDGKNIVSGSSDNTIIIWDAESGRQIRVLSGHIGTVQSVAYSPDGKRIVSGAGSSNKQRYDDCTIRIWDAESGRRLRVISGHAHEIRSVTYSPDGKHIMSRAYIDGVKIWNAKNGRLLRTFPGGEVVYSPDGKSIAFGEGYGITIRDAESGREVQTLLAQSKAIGSVVYNPDSKNITAGSIDGKIFIWDAESGRQLRIHSVPVVLSGNTYVDSYNFFARSMVYSPDGKHLTVTMNLQTVKIIDIETGREVRTLSWSMPNTISDIRVVYSPDGRRIVTGSSDGLVRIWDAMNGRLLHTLSGHTSGIWALAYSPDGKYIASGSHDTKVRIWDAESGKGILFFSGHTDDNTIWGAVRSLAYSPDGRYIASSSPYTIRIWDAQNGQEKISIRGGVQCLAYSPDGKNIVAGNGRGILILNAESGRVQMSLVGHIADVRSVAYSSDGKKILSHSFDNTIRLWDAATGKEIVLFISFSGSDSQLSLASRGLSVETETASSAIEGEWLSITPDGYYQASPRGDRFLNVRVNNTVSGIDSYRSVFYNPDVLQARLQGRPDPSSKANVTIQQAASFIPPQVTIRSPSTFTTTNTATTNLSVTVTDQNQPIKNIKIFVNGRAVARNELAAIKGNNLQPERTSLTVTGNQRTVNFELPLTLDPGRNLIEVVAFNGYSESVRLSPVEVTYNAQAGQRPQLPNLWILAIGVNNYENSSQVGGNLRFAVADAKRLTETLKSQEGRRYAKVNSLIIGDGEATLPTADNIKRSLTFLDQAGDRDIVLLFLAGHGVSAQNGRFFFLPRDAVVTGSSGNWRVDERRAISGEEITAVLEGQGNRLLFIDACQSGGVDNNRMIRAMMESNAFVFAASQGNELSYEDARWGGGHGVFTYNVLNALRGAPAALAEGNVSVRSMSGFVSLEVPKATENRQNPKVYSLLFADFPLAVIR